MATNPPEEYDDVNEAAVAEWKRETTTRERIKAVATRTTDPTPAAEIAAQASASEPVTRDELGELVALGVVERIDGGQGALYKRNDQLYIYQQVLTIHDEYSAAGMVERLQDLKATVSEIRTRYGVESPAELAQQLDPDDQKGWADHTTWQTTEKNLYLVKAAISFDDAQNVVA